MYNKDNANTNFKDAIMMENESGRIHRTGFFGCMSIDSSCELLNVQLDYDFLLKKEKFTNFNCKFVMNGYVAGNLPVIMIIGLSGIAPMLTYFISTVQYIFTRLRLVLLPDLILWRI